MYANIQEVGIPNEEMIIRVRRWFIEASELEVDGVKFCSKINR